MLKDVAAAGVADPPPRLTASSSLKNCVTSQRPRSTEMELPSEIGIVCVCFTIKSCANNQTWTSTRKTLRSLKNVSAAAMPQIETKVDGRVRGWL